MRKTIRVSRPFNLVIFLLSLEPIPISNRSKISSRHGHTKGVVIGSAQHLYIVIAFVVGASRGCVYHFFIGEYESYIAQMVFSSY